jgi:hypothetical protein
MLLSLSLLVALAASSVVPRGTPSNVWAGKIFESLVTFGDSYTDEQRVNYFALNNGTAPPVGWVEPIVRPFLSYPSPAPASLQVPKSWTTISPVSYHSPEIVNLEIDPSIRQVQPQTAAIYGRVMLLGTHR